MDTVGKKKIGFLKSVKADWQLWVLVMPLLIWLALYAYKPLVGMLIAFQDYNVFKGMLGSKFVGLDNFTNLMTGPSREFFWRSFWNTIIISSYGIIFGFPVPIILAVLFHELKSNKIRNAVQTVTYAPHFISEVIICSLVLTFLAVDTGLINILIGKALQLFGMEYDQIHFMGDSNFFRGIFILTGIWKEAGFASIVFFAALCGIPMELYEAARIDGATRFRQIISISIPGIATTIVVMLIIRIGNILNVGYERVLLLYNPGIYDKADILSTFIYRLGMENNPKHGLSTAASLFNSVIGFALVIVSNKIAKKYSETSLW